jgi:hypothetical protein
VNIHDLQVLKHPIVNDTELDASLLVIPSYSRRSPRSGTRPDLAVRLLAGTAIGKTSA